MEIGSDGPTLILSGDFDVRSTGAVRSAINDHLEAWGGDITIDIHAVEAVDLTALKVLAAASRRALRTGHHIVLTGASPQVLRMLHLTHLIRLVELERDEATA
ncbi:MAG: STAS domain-containing protein [Nocardioidaceae bacterium]|nr:STAS domain-containing protein [Nocardioidaceae bacterium]MCL2614022.1 STAS domain-containing protein [Nocardioidaceae bacterium]